VAREKERRSRAVAKSAENTQIYTSLNELRQTFGSRSRDREIALAGTGRTASAKPVRPV